MNTHYIKIQGKANIAETLSIGHNYRIESDCSITSESKVDNEDGSYSITWKAEPVTITVTKENGEIIRAKDPRKNSQKIRNYLFKHYHNEGIVEDFDRLYDEFTMLVLRDTPILLREAVKRLQENETK